jgi:hypothetical protein
MENTSDKRKNLQRVLQNSVMSVTFKKVNGEERVMKCTLDPSIIPPATKTDPLSQEKVRKINEEVLPVWDIEKEQWRSFRLDSITNIEQAT